MNVAKKINNLTIQIPVNIIIDDEYLTPKSKLLCITPPPPPRANKRNRLKFYGIIPFPQLCDIYSTPDKTKKKRCESMPPIPKINRFGRIKITDLIPKRLKYDEDI